jgi:hypothetical protein
VGGVRSQLPLLHKAWQVGVVHGGELWDEGGQRFEREAWCTHHGSSRRLRGTKKIAFDRRVRVTASLITMEA